jgi:hypothetical protein
VVSSCFAQVTLSNCKLVLVTSIFKIFTHLEISSFTFVQLLPLSNAVTSLREFNSLVNLSPIFVTTSPSNNHAFSAPEPGIISTKTTSQSSFLFT